MFLNILFSNAGFSVAPRGSARYCVPGAKDSPSPALPSRGNSPSPALPSGVGRMPVLMAEPCWLKAYISPLR